MWEYEGPAKEIAVNDTVLETLRYLYGREPIPFQTLTFQRGTEQRGHADTIHFSPSLPARFMCAVWVAFEDITPDSGALFYYPGSRSLPELAPHDLGFTADTFDYVAYEDHQEALMKATGHQPKQFHAKKGDAVLWSSNVVHGGSPILDPDSTRRSQVTHYFFDDCVYYTPIPMRRRAAATSPLPSRHPRPAAASAQLRRPRAVALSALRNGRSRIRDLAVAAQPPHGCDCARSPPGCPAPSTRRRASVAGCSSADERTGASRCPSPALNP